MSRVSHRSLWTLGLIAATLAFSGGTLWWMSTRSPRIPFLPSHSGAQWIVYPTPPHLWSRKRVPLPSVFERSFSIDAVPALAPLEMRAFGQVTISINGEQIALPTGVDSNWKEPFLCDVAPNLHAGDNDVVVTVTQDAGRPALWLLLRIGGKRLKSDSSWEVTYAGASKRSAHPAHRPLGRGSLRLDDAYLMAGAEDAGKGTPSAATPERQLSERPERSIASLVDRLPTIFGFALLAVAVVGTIFYWHPGNTTDDDSEGLTTSKALLICSAAAVVWVALGWNNHRSLARASGPDSVRHLEYIDHIVKKHTLPLPGDGKQMHQPPLYYLAAAGLLGSLGLDTADNSGVALVRALTFLCGIVHVYLVFGSMRLIFPSHPHCQVVGLLIAAFLPVHLFIFHYPTNETMSAMCSSATVYVTLRILRLGDLSFRWHLLLGICLGAALLSKITALVLLGVIPFVLAGKLLADRIYRPLVWLKTLGVMILACTLVCGWHYARIASAFGNPLVRYADLEGGGGATWKDPGCHTSADFWRLGQVLVTPYFAGFYSFGDALYSTMWGDGRYGGGGRLMLRVPWNYDLMAAGYLLALLPCAAMAIGLIAAIVGLLRRPSAIWMLLLGLSYSMAFALIIENLRHPYLIVAKAWYTLPVIVPLCAFGAWGFDLVTGRRRWLRFAMYAGMATWAINSYASFWIVNGSSSTNATWAMRYMIPEPEVGSESYRTAVGYLKKAVAKNPNDAYARFALGKAYNGVTSYDQAIEQFEAALRLNPNDPYSHKGLAEIYGARRDMGRALNHLQKANELHPDYVEARYLQGRIHEVSGAHDKAIAAYREMLRIKPDSGYQHAVIGALYEKMGDRKAAYAHYQWAIDVSERATAHIGLARMFYEDDRPGEALAHYRQALEKNGELDEAANGLAWILATNSDAKLRDGAEALRLSEEVVKRHIEAASFLRTHAAALAETGDFEAARVTAEKALERAEKERNDGLAREIREQLRYYRAHLFFRE